MSLFGSSINLGNFVKEENISRDLYQIKMLLEEVIIIQGYQIKQDELGLPHVQKKPRASLKR